MCGWGGENAACVFGVVVVRGVSVAHGADTLGTWV